MKNEIKIRKRRFIAGMLTVLLLLNQLPPISARAAEYAAETLSSDQILTPGDKISNDSDTPCVITYYDYGETGGELSSDMIEQGVPHTVPAYTDVPDGFEFTGWKVLYVSTASGGMVESITLEAMVAINGTEIGDSLFGVTLNAGMVIYSLTDNYTITYYDQDGETTLIEAAEISAYTAYTVAGYPGTVPTGYQFAGWEVASVWASGGIGEIFLTARLAVDQFTITFDTNGGSAVAAITANYGAAITAPDDPTKTGYTFAGWDKEIPATMPAENVTITAQWTANKYTIQFVNEDGSELETSEVAYGETPVYNGATPTKAATVEHSYTFSGWTPEITAVTGGATYTATYTETVNKYTIEFVNEDGTVLQSSEVAYGEMPVYSGETPTKAATAQHSYSFAGWTPEIAAVTGNATYTATFTESTNQYTIQFVDEDGTQLQSGEVAYGETPVYSGETPTKEATAEYTYSFAGWSPEVTAVTGEAIYTATYTAITNQYTVRFVDEDGTELQSSEVAYGETPVYSGETPTKEATAQYTYSFAGWTPAIVAVTGDATYTAIYTETVNQYTIKFVNEDGTELQSGEVAYGEMPVYNGETPAKAATAQYTYTFAGWSPEVTAVTGEATYTAAYTTTTNQYTIRFVDDDGTELQSSAVAYGEIPVYSGETPAKAATAQYTYAFTGWTPEITAVTGDATYTAIYTETVNQYTIKFVNEDGTELQTSEVAYGEMPVYSGEAPTKEATAEHSYTFAGWTPEITAVTGDATYTATYTETANQYTITFDTAGGSSVAPITQAYGTAVTAPDDPTRTGYTFVNWNPEIPATMPAEDITILARWTANEYTISFNTDGGSNVDAITQNYGTTVTAPANPTKTGYTFAGWDKAIPTTMPAENITITARWTVESYSIRYILNGGTNGENPGSYTYGTGVSGFADAVKPGYNFVGWYENADFSGDKVTSIPANRTGDITLYAKFEMGTIEAGTYSLTAGVAYKLGNVTKVSGDNSVYTAGSIFYVPTSGTYTFS